MKRANMQTIERIEREFHRRAFGEEMARVNFLPPSKRRAYAARLARRALSRRRGFSSPFGA